VGPKREMSTFAPPQYAMERTRRPSNGRRPGPRAGGADSGASGAPDTAPAAHVPIDGFMVVRNGFRYGYPFLESIRSALELCDAVHVADGFSDDGTFEALQAFAARETRVRVTRSHWPTRGGGGEPIREALNALRRSLTAPVLFQFDANDFVPPESARLLRELPTLYPDREIFALPYRQFLGRYWFNEEFRFRLVRNLRTVEVLWDGWTLGYHLGFSDLLRHHQLRRLLGRAALAVLQDRVAVDLPEHWVNLPRPISHFYGLFPAPFLEKMRQKTWMQGNSAYRGLTTEDGGVRAILDRYERTGDYDRFWSEVLRLQRDRRASGIPFNKKFLYTRYVPDQEQPSELSGVLGRAQYRPDSQPDWSSPAPVRPFGADTPARSVRGTPALLEGRWVSTP
jgi:glycosyltransferase involved in cell wall biosynthesis